MEITSRCCLHRIGLKNWRLGLSRRSRDTWSRSQSCAQPFRRKTSDPPPTWRRRRRRCRRRRRRRRRCRRRQLHRAEKSFKIIISSNWSSNTRRGFFFYLAAQQIELEFVSNEMWLKRKNIIKQSCPTAEQNKKSSRKWEERKVSIRLESPGVLLKRPMFLFWMFVEVNKGP